MTDSAAPLTADVFDRVAKSLPNWSPKSLSVVRELLVDGVRISTVAANNTVSVQHAGVLRTRFLAKVKLSEIKKVSVTDFMLSERPQAEAELDPFRAELLKLYKKKYSLQQMLQYLASNGIKTSEQTLTSFLQEANTNANSRISK